MPDVPIGVRTVDFPNLGTVTDDTSILVDRAGTGRVLASALRDYMGQTFGNVSTAMAPVVSAATLAAGRAAFGATTIGEALYTAPSAAAARSALGVVVADLTGALNITATGHFYASLGAKINRINDRLLVGPATVQDGNWSGAPHTWLGNTAGAVNVYMDRLSVMEVITAPGASQALSVGGRTSDAAAGQDGVFGITTVGWNDHPTINQSGWGLYSSAARVTSHGVYTSGIESDVTTLQAYVATSAYNAVPTGVTTAFTAGGGGESALRTLGGPDSGLSVNPTSAAFTIIPAGSGVNQANPLAGTGALFGKGIVFQSNSIIGTDGSSGTFGVAIEMARGHAIVWANNVGATAIGGMIRSDNVSGQSAFQQRAVFGATRFQIKGVLGDLTTEVPLFEVSANPLTAGAITDNLVALPGHVGSPPSLLASGTPDDIDVSLLPKGQGLVRIGNRAATPATTAANFSADFYYPVKDVLNAVYYIPMMASGW